MSSPIECYRFNTPRGNICYTTHDSSVSVDGLTYIPHQIERSAIEISADTSSISTIDIIVSSTSEMALDYGFELTPQDAFVQVLRVNLDNMSFTVEWTGEIISASTSGNKTTLKTVSIVQTEMNNSVANVIYQSSCNHELYDALCGVDRSAHTESATVTKVIGREITVDDDQFPNDALNIGTIVDLRNGETRAIIKNVDNVIEVSYPFVDIRIGDVVELSRGCDHARLGNCKNVFNNVERYGGFDFVPVENPFETGKV